MLARLRLDEDRLFLVLAVFTGGFAGFIAVLYHLFLDSLFTSLFGGIDFTRHTDWRLVAVPMLGGLLAALVLKWLPQARGSGVAHTKIAIVARDGYISLRSTMGKFFASGIAIGMGQSMGPEGPAIHIGAGVASLIGRLTSLSKDKLQQLIPVGAAAGLAAVFNAPITAVLFILEEVIGDVNTPLLGSTIVAAVVAVIVARSVLGGEPLFQVPAYTLGGSSELLIFAVLGLIGGAASVGFTSGLAWARIRIRRVPPRLRFWMPVVGAALVGLMALLFPQILSVGYNYVNDVLNGRMGLSTMFWLTIFKILATALCIAFGNVGGLFAPSLFMGAMLGGAVGGFAHILFPASRLSDVGAYALIGMGTMFAGVNRTPMTSIFMIFEVTQDYNLIMPLMVANILAYAVAGRLQHEGIYEIMAEQDGIHLPSSKNRHVLQRLTNSDALAPSSVFFHAGESVQQVLPRVQGMEQSAFPVMKDGALLGLVATKALTREMAEHRPQTPVGNLAEWQHSAMVFPDESLEDSLRKLGNGAPVLAVVSRLDSHQLLGVLTTSDIMNAFGIAARSAPVETAADPVSAGSRT